MKTKPLAKYDLVDNVVEYKNIPKMVWAAILDKRYKLEVVREKVGATFRIYDSGNNDELIHEQKVNLMFGARFGPDMADVAEWQQIGCKIVDEP
jgi:hypothetical protein